MASLSTATKGTRTGVQHCRKIRPNLLRCNLNLSGSFEMADAARGIKGWHETGLVLGRSRTAGHGRITSCMTRSSRNSGGEGCSEVAHVGLGIVRSCCCSKVGHDQAGDFWICGDDVYSGQKVELWTRDEQRGQVAF